jgi:uncharacterized protein (TIGR02145 family)
MNLKYLIIIALMGCVITACKSEEPEPEVLEVVISNLKEEYFEGDTLNLNYLRVYLSMSNGHNFVSFSEFADYGLTCYPENGTILTTENKLFTVTHNLSSKFDSKVIIVYERTVTDFDGNVYLVTKIGSQIWMAENLKVKHYKDGRPVSAVLDLNGNGSTNDEWGSLNNNDKAYCYYNDDTNSRYGLLYTWAAAVDGNPNVAQGICPNGWHVPSDMEWSKLTNYLLNNGYANNRAQALKSVEGWSNNGNGTNETGFTDLPGGYRLHNPFAMEHGQFLDEGLRGEWWTRTEGSTGQGAYPWYLMYNSYSLELGGGLYGSYKPCGFSVRCIKD